MMRAQKRFLIAAILWMAVIFCFSQRNSDESSGDSGRVGRFIGRIVYSDFDSWTQEEQQVFIDGISFPLRKAAHGTEYAILGILLLGALDDRKKALLFLVGTTELLCFLYACTDEFHQLFVPGRAGSFRDVLIDSFGALIGLLLAALIRRKNRRSPGDGRSL